jgi:hypothetical protein
MAPAILNPAQTVSLPDFPAGADLNNISSQTGDVSLC